jgi:cell division protein FtsI/penicillin-binding protein 2
VPAASSGQSSRRLSVMFALLVAVALAIGVRLFYWQIMRYDELSSKGNIERMHTLIEYARRGDILTNDGVLLASDIYSYEIAAHPKTIDTPEVTAALLAPILGESESTVFHSLQQKDQTTVMLALNAPSSAGAKLVELQSANKLGGIEFNAKPYRRYPAGTLAAQVLGFVTADRVGAYGVEQYYNDMLRGHDGEIMGEGSAIRDELLPFDLPSGISAVDGDTLELTINSAMQNIAETELSRALEDNGGTGGQIVVLDANTSAILAMASEPTPNLNNYATTRLDEYHNPAVSLPYEPGSVFKVVTLATGLDSGRINQNITFNDTGTCVVGGRTFYNHDFLHPGVVNLIDVMKLSLNVEACKISIATGAKIFYQYMHDFGLGSISGVDLADEIPGTVKQPGDGLWYELDLGANAFGQGIAVTPLQMANALAVVANGGKLMRPYVVQKIVHADGTFETRGPHIIRQVLKPETAHLVTQILTQSIGKESINQAVIPGYRIAGKTGTAQIPIPGGYDPKWTIASFGGYLPADHPQFVILVKIDRPVKSPWGSVVASPVFARVAQQLVQLTGLPPDDVRALEK